ncbi:MAG: hypothetical protein LBL13_10955 [Bacteroidales bacterium]|nr:hypothetical protein [Bacteroidales bacterium]
MSKGNRQQAASNRQASQERAKGRKGERAKGRKDERMKERWQQAASNKQASQERTKGRKDEGKMATGNKLQATGRQAVSSTQMTQI